MKIEIPQISLDSDLADLIDQRKLKPVAEGARKYVISFSNNYIYRSVIYVLGNKGFLQP